MLVHLIYLFLHKTDYKLGAVLILKWKDVIIYDEVIEATLLKQGQELHIYLDEPLNLGMQGKE